VPVFKRPHFEKIIALAEKGRIAPLYLFLGDQLVGQELLRRLWQKLGELGHQLEELDLGEVSWETAWNRLKTPALIGRKVFHLKNPSAALNHLTPAFFSFLEKHKARLSLCLVLEALKENHPLYLFALEKGVLVPLPSPRKRDLLKTEIPEILAAFNKKMDRQTAEELLFLVGEDLVALEQELTKLSLYVGERAVITVEDVREVVSPHAESAPYQLLEAFWREGAAGALNVLRSLLLQGLYPLVILATLVTYFKRLFLIKEILARAEALARSRDFSSFKNLYAQVLKELFPHRPPKELQKLHPYAAYKMVPQAQKVPQEAFPQIFKELLALDAKLKRGGLPEEEFFLFFCFLEKVMRARREGPRFQAISL